MAAQGLSPTLETMADLSGQYIAIQEHGARNTFLFVSFGRSGDELALIMSQGGDSIREMGGAVDESLIVTEQAFIESEKYRMSLDLWNDSVQALKISIGSELLPVLNFLIEGMNQNNAAQQLAIQDGQNWLGLTAQQKANYLELAASQRQAADTARIFAQHADEGGDASRRVGGAIDEVNEAAGDTGEIDKWGDAINEAGTTGTQAIAETQNVLDSYSTIVPVDQIDVYIEKLKQIPPIINVEIRQTFTKSGTNYIEGYMTR